MGFLLIGALFVMRLRACFRPSAWGMQSADENSTRALSSINEEEYLMADHLDAPGLMSPDANAKTDITDVYVFQKPGDPSKTILILNVNPLAPMLAKEFESNGLYELKIDTDADAIPEIVFRIAFTPVEDGKQWATVRRAEGEEAARDENSGEVIIKHAPVSFDSKARVTKSGHYTFFAGLRSDPFFFDLSSLEHRQSVQKANTRPPSS
jgi:hypothetical protein